MPDQSAMPFGFVSTRELKHRNWPLALIPILLAGPDMLLPHPRRRNGPPLKLYDLLRVLEAERSEQFRAAAKAAAAKARGR